MSTQPNLYVSPFRLSGNPFIYLSSFSSKDHILIKNVSPQAPEQTYFMPFLTISPQTQIVSPQKILEFLWKKSTLSQKKDLTFTLENKESIEIFKLYDQLFDYLAKKPNTDPLPAFIDSFKLLEFQDSWLKSPPLAMILYESINALQLIDPSFLNKKSPYTKFLRLMEINPLYQPFLFKDDILIKPISPFVPSLNQLIKEKILHNLPTLIDFAGLNSALYTYQSKETNYWEHIPFSGFPTLQISKAELEALRGKSLVWNKLFDRLVRRIEIFDKIFENLSQVDMFVARLWKISQKKRAIKKNGLEFCIFRNDYMRDGVLEQWKQIEFNTIAVSFGYMTDCVQKLHHLIYNQIFKDFTQGKSLACFPEASHLLADGLAHAHKLYKKSESRILFVVGAHEGNILDQRGLELLLGYRGVLVLRKTFEDIIKEIKVKDDVLFIGEQEISVVYLRHGYSPSHYVEDEHWKVREMMEMSKAIKCPSVEFQLINFKKIQEVLERKDILEQLLDTSEEIEAITEDFVEIYSLDTANEQSKALDLVISHHDDYVLKPQREGGGNNTYGSAIIEKFKSAHASSELKAFILMKRIKPIPRTGFLIKKRQLDVCGVISELGLFSYLISDEKSILESRYGGYLLRTKHFETNEGGVATGYSVLDSAVFEEEKEEEVEK